MKHLVTTNGSTSSVFNLLDPDEPLEREFEKAVIQALPLTFKGYQCFKFNGTFEHDGRRSRPDLALIAQDLSHWFVVEVELRSHSLHGHVIPQVRTIQYGRPLDDCAMSMSRILGVSPEQGRTMMHMLPRRVAVVANRFDEEWATALRAVEVQMLSVHAFRSSDSHEAYLVEGLLLADMEHLGFGMFSATDNAVRFSTHLIRIPGGVVQIQDPTSAVAEWSVTKTPSAVWITKVRGTPSPAFVNGRFIQLLRTQKGQLIFRHMPA